MDHLTLSMRSYNLAYLPEIQASLDDRLLKIQTDLRDITKVIHKDILLAMQQRLGAQQPGEEDEDEIMESASEPETPPGSPPGPPLGSPSGSPPRSPLCAPVHEEEEEEEEEQMMAEEAAPMDRTQGDSEEEEESDERNLEISLRIEANMLEARAKNDLLHAWREAKEYKEDVEKEAARYGDAADRQFRKVGTR